MGQSWRERELVPRIEQLERRMELVQKKQVLQAEGDAQSSPELSEMVAAVLLKRRKKKKKKKKKMRN